VGRERLVAFAAARSEHMRAARPVGAVSSERIPSAAPSEGPLSEMPPSSALESQRIPFGARVLLVDDDPGTGDEVRAMLSEIGLNVDVVGSAETASARMHDQPFDAVVLDLHAPGLDPRDFVRRLRADPLTAPLPVLFLSSRPTSRDVVDAFASGADDFLPKPFRTSELAARIFGLLRRARVARTALAGGGAR
jgi:two-component system, OmpR family, phosphate regulon response regulator PhoB